MGQRARFERFAADMLYVIAAGKRIDDKRTEGFSAQVDKVYGKPFKRKKQPKTTEEIIDYVLKGLGEL